MNLAYLHGKPEVKASIRNQNEDFEVEEVLGFEPDGAGEHLWLWVEKNGQNTAFIGKEIAKAFGVSAKSVSHSGLKDRHAVTRQWFNLPWPIKQDIPTVELENAKIFKTVRHGKKLKIGTHKANFFRLKIKLEQAVNLDERLTAIKQFGVANYFGEQRFGRDGDNLDNAIKMFSGELKVKDRKLQSIYLSSARSYLFNQILDARIQANMFKPVAGDAFILSGSNSFFKADVIDDEIIARFESGDILLSGSLFGKGDSIVSGEVAQLEENCLNAYPQIVAGLIEAGLKQERRALQLPVSDFNWSYSQNNNEYFLEVEFKLPAGCFATSVLREIVDYQDVSKS
ncbi:tRNA pseudouridine(13) synthase TruD [Catenovulum sp. 2E275]|uniref:tRNA pseudouridine(13) synthase TruD n=1 Tax=Catenovulum sp. 2E275 TaxID=2980497 RepID=UPI0021CFE65B|nr:tRNA pseudouridine(13) synthase TruD [Catenovulum sp. 2E275]MCU4676909.1 tRNA pseudouridine(13) synthase TruD [Catenovulum sp. 2E275]